MTEVVPSPTSSSCVRLSSMTDCGAANGRQPRGARPAALPPAPRGAAAKPGATARLGADSHEVCAPANRQCAQALLCLQLRWRHCWLLWGMAQRAARPPTLAAGCETSISRRMALPSLVSTMPPLASSSILSIARGPSVVRTMSATACRGPRPRRNQTGGVLAGAVPSAGHHPPAPLRPARPPARCAWGALWPLAHRPPGAPPWRP